MTTRLSLALVCFGSLILSACGSSTDGDRDPARSGQQPLEYVEPCTPAECDASAIPMIGCADGSEPTLSCAPDDEGSCHVTPQCDGGSSSGDEPISYAPCEESECGPIPQIGCPSDYSLVQSCGSENGGACLWTITCVPPPSTTPCSTPDGCGPMPELAPICDDGQAGTLACMQTGDDCSWQPQCP